MEKRQYEKPQIRVFVVQNEQAMLPTSMNMNPQFNNGFGDEVEWN